MSNEGMAAPPHTINGRTEAQLRAWVEAHPECVDDYYAGGCTPLYMAVDELKSLSLTLWLLDEKGADVNCRSI